MYKVKQLSHKKIVNTLLSNLTVQMYISVGVSLTLDNIR